MKRTPGRDFAGTAMNELVFLWSVICSGVALFPALSDGQTQAEAGRSDERAVLVGTDDGVYRLRGRVDGDLVWRAEAVYRTEGRSVRGLAVDPESRTLVVGFGMRGAGMVMSPDAGDSWTRVPHWPNERQAWSIAFDRRGRVLAGSQPADIWHADGLTGEWRVNQSVQAIPERKDWTFIRPPYEAHIVTLARDPKSPHRWLAAVEQGGVLASEDDGRTWRQCSPLWDTHVVAFLPEGAIVAATAGGLQLSADGARSWQSAEQPRGYGTGLSIDADGIVYAVVKGADHGPIWYSKDAGRTWEPAPDGATLPHPDFGVHALAADPLIAGTLYYGAGDAVWLLSARSARKIAEGLPPIRRVLVLTTSPTPEKLSLSTATHVRASLLVLCVGLLHYLAVNTLWRFVVLKKARTWGRENGKDSPDGWPQTPP
jgi:hypothetical protein